MKRLFLLSMFIILAFSAFAQKAWTVQTVPNTRLQSNDIHVSDPDCYLSDSAEMSINMALCAIRDTADVFLVTLTSIGDAEPKHFATSLLNYWGIGDAQKDNGVLLLFVEDQHALEFETGYGAEATLTDVTCQRIFTKTIVPFFKAGDYESGLCAGVARIVDVYGGEIPMGLKMDVPAVDDEDVENDDFEDFSFAFRLFALFVFVMPWVGLYFWLGRRKKKSPTSDKYSLFEEGGATYIDGFKTAWSGSPWEGKGCLCGAMLGLSIFVFLFIVITFVMTRFPDLEGKPYYNRISIVTLLLYLTWVCFRQNHRALKTAEKLAKQSVNPKSVYEAAYENSGNKIATWMAPWLGWVYYLTFKNKMEHADNCCCPNCGETMRKDGMFRLPENHLAENRVGALKYTPYRCVRGHAIVVKEHGKLFSRFSTCSKCGAYTLKLTKTETLVEADYTKSGKKKETYVCQHCGEVIEKTITIPKKVHYTSSGGSYSSSSSSGGSYSSHSSSHSSGGSFGGGRSGGGGYSGRW